MDKTELNDIEVASPSVVRSAARDFATALKETPQFKAFEIAYKVWRQDTSTQKALSAYQAKAASLRAVLMLNAVSEAERAELARLEQDYLTRPSVQAYEAAQADLIAVCQQAAGMISSSTGLNYAASCGASCCG